MREDAISLGGSKLVQIWFSFPDLTIEVLNSWDLDRSAARVADIDGDGDLDLLAKDTSKDIYVYVNDGDGNFAAKPKVTQNYPSQLSAADVDGDELADLITVTTTGFSKHFVRVGLSAGDGTFMLLPPVEVLAMNGIPLGKLSDHTVGDLNGDDRPDIVLGDTLGVSTLIGGPGGTFTFASRVDGGDFGAGVALGDWDADGKLDLVHVSTDDYLFYIRKGLGDGSFSDPPRSYNAGHGCAGSTRSARIDGDDHLDVALGCPGIGVALGRGDGTLHAAPALRAGSLPSESAIGDVNEDGDPDVVTAFAASKIIAVFPGLGDGNFGPTLPPLKEVGQPKHLRLADMNADGHLDLVSFAVNGMQNGLRVRLGDGAGHFADPPVALVPFVVWPEVGDMDGDGDLDIVATGLNGINVLRNDGSGALVPDASIDGDGDGPDNLTLADLDQDGDLDVIGSQYQLKEIELFWNNGDGSFAAPSTLMPSPDAVWRVLAGDYTSDGVPDLLRATTSGDPTAPGITVFPGNGDGTFAAGIESKNIQFSNEGDVLTADFTNDGHLDLFHTRGNGFAIARIGLGDGQFGPEISYPFVAPAGFAAADLNHDQLRDVILVTRIQQARAHVAVFINISK